MGLLLLPLILVTFAVWIHFKLSFSFPWCQQETHFQVLLLSSLFGIKLSGIVILILAKFQVNTRKHPCFIGH